MAFRARDHVTALSALASAAALALVFGAVTGALPDGALPPADDAVLAAVPHVNAAISLAAIAAIATGWRAIRHGNVRRHRRAMGTAFLLFAAFLGLYLYRVSLRGPTAFPGPEAVYASLYLPTLAVHVLLAIVCVPLLFYVLLLALTRPAREIPDTRHRAVGRVAASLWLLSFALGLVVYLLLYVVY